jgi:hypothetical protein
LETDTAMDETKTMTDMGTKLSCYKSRYLDIGSETDTSEYKTDTETDKDTESYGTLYNRDGRART